MHGKVFLACAFGGGIGSLVALQIWQPFWWVGLIAGGLVGYLTYDFKQVLRAIPQALELVCEGSTAILRHLGYAILRGGNLAIASSIFFPPLIIRVFLSASEWNKFFTDVLGGAVIIAAGFGLGPFIVSLLGVTEDENELLGQIYRFNIFTVYGYWLPLGIVFVARTSPVWIPTTVRFVGRFIKYFFLLIHSELRLLCAFDAAMGALIGYLLGSALIGALAGGIIGVINYEVVSKRWLNLVPR